MTPEERAELRALCEQATPAIQKFGRNPAVGESLFSYSPPDFVDPNDPRTRFQFHPLNLLNTRYGAWDANGSANRDLIVASRTAIPALLDALDAAEAREMVLRERLDRARRDAERSRS